MAMEDYLIFRRRVSGVGNERGREIDCYIDKSKSYEYNLRGICEDHNVIYI